MIEYKKSQIITLLKETIDDIDEMAIGAQGGESQRRGFVAVRDKEGKEIVTPNVTSDDKLRTRKVLDKEYMAQNPDAKEPKFKEIKYDAAHLYPIDYEIIKDPETGKKIWVKVRKIYQRLGFYKLGNNGERPDYWLINPTKEPGKGFIVMPMDCEDVSEFIEKEREYIKLIQRYHKGVPVNIAYCSGKKPIYVPGRQGRLDYRYSTHPEEIDRFQWPKYQAKTSQPLNTKLKTIFNKIFKKYFGDFDRLGGIRAETEKSQDTRDIFLTRNIPYPVLTSKFIDRYSDKWNNDLIEYQGITSIGYTSAKDYYNSIKKGIDDNKMLIYSSRRQFNPGEKWKKTRPSEKEYRGKTAYYKLDSGDFKSKDLKIIIENDWRISGMRQGDKFRWFINMKLNFGDKRPRQYMIDNLYPVEFKPEIYNIFVEKIVDLDPQRHIKDDYVVLEDISVVMGLEELFSDFIDKVESIEPENALQRLNNAQLKIQETNLVNKVLSEIKSRF
jgi:hypothetical protein